MSEKPPEKEGAYEMARRLNDAGFELQRQDNEDPVRGSIVRHARAVMHAAYTNHEDPLFEDLSLFQRKFIEHFGSKEAGRYRLFHYIIGSSPSGEHDLFDAEGEWSIAGAMRKLAEKYHIDTGAV
ncbi:MAG: hypothetical protein KGH56_03780 [Patescibacteria group bacterium]|nr:hypothetical protein [Patescibacteria group bacterium]